MDVLQHKLVTLVYLFLYSKAQKVIGVDIRPESATNDKKLFSLCGDIKDWSKIEKDYWKFSQTGIPH